MTIPIQQLLFVQCLAILFLVGQNVDAADWPMRGRDQNRNAVVADEVGPLGWDLSPEETKRKKVRWSVQLGTYSHGDPVISQGLVWVGTNNGHPRDPMSQRDAGVLMCFDERDGKFLYQYLSPRLPEGRQVDWPSSSQCGSPLIEKDRLWFCNTRCEVICLDIAPLLKRTGDPTVVWKLDMRAKLHVAPRAVMIGSNSDQCSIAEYRDWIYINTTNAAEYDRIPTPQAPSLICLNKQTGEVKWQDNSPGTDLFDVQHGSPLVAEIQGRAQVIMGQGDGWVRGFDALTGEVLWKFDINPKSVNRKQRQFKNDCSDMVVMPVLYEGKIYFGTGRHYEASGGPGWVYCVDPTKRGDISGELVDDSGQPHPNPNSGLVWQYAGRGKLDGERMHQTVSSVAIHDGLLFIPDASGLLHCVDARTGEGLWFEDFFDNVMTSPLIIGKRVYVGVNGVQVYELSRKKNLIAEHDSSWSMEASPVYANGTLFLTTRRELFAIQE